MSIVADEILVKKDECAGCNQKKVLLSYVRQVAQRMRKGGACAWCNLLDTHHQYCLANAIIRVVDLVNGPDISDDGTLRVSVPSELLGSLEKAADIQHVPVPALPPPDRQVRQKKTTPKPLTFSQAVMRRPNKNKIKAAQAKIRATNKRSKR